MKITMYELLGMIKDGKAPIEIKYNDYLLTWDSVDEDYYCENYGNLFEYLFTNIQTTEILNDEVEIIEEENKIPEKITINDNGTIGFPNGEWTARNMDKAFAMKINSIIDYLKSKGE